MRRGRATVVLAAFAFSSSCAYVDGYQTGKVLTGMGVIATAAGGAAAYATDNPSPSVLAAMTPGLVITAIGLFFLIDGRPAPPSPGPSPQELERAAQYQRDLALQREAAWTLTKDAAAAARDGNCARVIEIDANVKAMDAELHATVFLRDVAIERCLQQR